MGYDELLELFKGRRTIRAIKADPVPEDIVAKLLEAARWAPTGFNMQPVELVVVRDADLKIGYGAMEGGPAAKLMRRLEEMVHYDRAADDEFPSEEELRSQIKKLRAGNVARHAEGDKAGATDWGG